MKTGSIVIRFKVILEHGILGYVTMSRRVGMYSRGRRTITGLACC